MNESGTKINIKDFFKYAYTKWKMVLFITVFITVVFAIFGFVKTKNKLGDYATAIVNYEEILQNYNAKISNLEKASSLEKNLYDKVLEYSENSYMMNLDENNIVSCNKVYVLNCHVNEKDNVSNQQSAYLVLRLLNDDFRRYIEWDKLESNLGISRYMINQLINIKTNYSEFSITINVKWRDKEGAELIMNSIISAFTNNKDKMSELNGYSVSELDVEFVEGEDQEIVNSQYSVSNLVDNYTDNYESDTEKLEKSIEPSAPRIEDYSIFGVFKSSIKYILVGIIFGIMIGLLCVFEYFSKKGIIYSVEEYEKLSGNVLLADCSDSNMMDNASRRLNKFISNRGKEKIMFVYDDNNDNCDNLNQLVKTINSKEVYVGGNLSVDMTALKLLKEVDSVVMVYTNKKTSLKDVVKYNDFMKQIDKKILGCIVV